MVTEYGKKYRDRKGTTVRLNRGNRKRSAGSRGILTGGFKDVWIGGEFDHVLVGVDWDDGTFSWAKESTLSDDV